LSEPNTTLEPDEGIGRRIARRRRARGLTQQGLADRAFVSVSLIQQVETGRKPATPSLVAAVATAMHIEPAEIYGQPYRGSTPQTDRVHASIIDLRRALACVDIPPDLETPPRSLDDLATEVAALQRMRQAARHIQLGARLPAAIAELSAHAHDADSPRAWRILNRAINIAVSLSRRLGYNDLAGLGIEHAVRTAARSDDANLPLVAHLSRSQLLMGMGAWAPGLKLVRQAARQADDDTPQSQTIYGALHLRAAILAARAGDSSQAWDHHGEAVEVAQRLPERTPDFYDIMFTRWNVDIHSVAVAVELTDYDDAIARDRAIVLPETMTATRRAHHDIDVGRALVWTGQWDAALRRLMQAENAAPQMTRYHPMARESVGRLLDHYRALPEPLRVLQDHMGLA
jgi:transcriptional regulator with XRE-family HTH domain